MADGAGPGGPVPCSLKPAAPSDAEPRRGVHLHNRPATRSVDQHPGGRENPEHARGTHRRGGNPVAGHAQGRPPSFAVDHPIRLPETEAPLGTSRPGPPRMNEW